jgi:hypothetical protein
MRFYAAELETRHLLELEDKCASLKDTLQSQIILTERHFQDLEMPEVKN